MWLTTPFDCEHKVKNVLLFSLPLVMNSSNVLETGPRGVGNAKCEDNLMRQKSFANRLHVSYSLPLSYDVHWS